MRKRKHWAITTTAIRPVPALAKRKKERIFAIVSFALPFAIYCLTLNSQGGQAVNIVAMQQSMLQHQTLAVGVNGTDTVRFAGSYYNVFAPGLAFLSLPFAAGGIYLGGLFGISNGPVLTDELFLSLAAALSGFLMHNICMFYTKNKLACLLTSLTFCLATSVWPFAVSIFPHDASLLFSMVAVYLVLKYTRSFRAMQIRLLVLAGLSLGVATLVEYAAALFVVPLTAYLVIRSKRENGFTPFPRLSFGHEAILFFLGAYALIGIGLNLCYNYLLFMDPLTFPQQLYSDGLHFFFGSPTIYHVLYNLISPYRGLFLLSPILLLGVYGMYRMMAVRETRLDASLFLSLFLAVLFYYSSWQGWDGGWSYGPRFLVLGLPYLVIPLATVIPTLTKFSEKTIFFLLFGLSSFLQEVGAIAGSAPPSQGIMQFQATSYSLPEIFENNFALWWISPVPNNDPTGIIIVLLLIFLAIITMIGYVTFKTRRGRSFSQQFEEFAPRVKYRSQRKVTNPGTG
jgi:hypothetical protein